MRDKSKKTADVCLILEGTYPYVLGGVSTWTHELIQMQSHLTFSLLVLLSADAPQKRMYELPANVIRIQTIRLQRLAPGASALPKRHETTLFDALETPLLHLQSQAGLQDLTAIIEALAPHQRKLGQRVLLDSPAAWDLLVRMYQKTMPGTSFLDYFWSWRGLFGGLFSILLADLPPAKAYHALCTGYAGLMLARAHLETGRPCILTEHGIYTNERRIEIACADWLDDPQIFNLDIMSTQDRKLKNFWIDTFANYSRLCYEACSRIVTLYEGNQEFQRADGAPTEKLEIIPNGIDIEHYGAIKHKPHPPTIALIGRVVPIKDIKTYIRAVHILKAALPNVRALMLGPDDEDAPYAQECRDLVEHLGLEKTLLFMGKVNVKDYFSIIDVVVLTSISEAQPLVILEAGAAGIPTVATDVGACREMILGTAGNMAAGGAIVPLAHPQAVAQALLQLLSEPEYYAACSRNIAQRVRSYYNKASQQQAYGELYQQLIGGAPETVGPQLQSHAKAA